MTAASFALRLTRKGRALVRGTDPAPVEEGTRDHVLPQPRLNARVFALALGKIEKSLDLVADQQRGEQDGGVLKRASPQI